MHACDAWYTAAKYPTLHPPPFFLTGVEVTPLCDADLCTPFTLRALQDPQPHQHDLPVRRLFGAESQSEVLPSDPLSDDSLVLSQVSTIESPDCQNEPDFMSSDEVSALEFSTDVSSTRKRRNHR